MSTPTSPTRTRLMAAARRARRQRRDAAPAWQRGVPAGVRGDRAHRGRHRGSRGDGREPVEAAARGLTPQPGRADLARPSRADRPRATVASGVRWRRSTGSASGARTRGGRMPDSSSSRTTRPRCPRYGSSSSSILASSPRASPASAQLTRFGRWKSPTLTASGSPNAAAGRLRRRPWPDARDALQSSQRVGRRHRAGRFQPRRSRRRPADGHGPSLLQACRMELVVGERGQSLGGRLESETRRTRRRLTEPEHDASIRRVSPPGP